MTISCTETSMILLEKEVPYKKKDRRQNDYRQKTRIGSKKPPRGGFWCYVDYLAKRYKRLKANNNYSERVALVLCGYL